MSTFRELQTRLAELKSRSTILQYLIEHVDSEFRAKAGTAAKRVLMTSEKLSVSEAELERMVVDLTEEMVGINGEIEQILGSPLTEAQPQVAQPPPPSGPMAFTPPVPLPAPLAKKAKKGANQEEVQS